MHPYRGVEQSVARRAHNPEVVGSSPASATIKIPGIQEEYRGFSCFFTGNENGAKVILGQFWASTSKNRFLGTPSGAAGRRFLCLLPEEHVCDALGSSDFIFLDDVE